MTAEEIGLYGQLACIWEATARKPGNVHRFADFEDTSYLDFLASAAAIAVPLSRAAAQSLGQTILQCVQATRQVVTGNTNLGMILLLAPLASARPVLSPATVEGVLQKLTVDDAGLCYQAIRVAQPGGLGEVAEQDVQQPPTQDLRAVMTLAADRDRIARQYASGFADIFTGVVPDLLLGLRRTGCLEGAILWTHLQQMSRHPDSLILRKRGRVVAEQVVNLARAVLDAGWPEETSGWQRFHALDIWLRADGHARNPGTTADLIAAGLFTLLCTGQIHAAAPWSDPARWAFSSV